MSTTKPEERMIAVDGVEYANAELTFREQRLLRETVRALAQDPDILPDDALLMDFLPALIFVIRRRENPEYSLEEALEEKTEDVLVPRKPQARRKAAGASS